MTKRLWSVRISKAAETDIATILAYTAERYGVSQVALYQAGILDSISTLYEGPMALGSHERPEIGQGIRTLHLSRSGRRGRHFIVYSTPAEGVIDVLRILHDAMDLSRHLPFSDR